MTIGQFRELVLSLQAYATLFSPHLTSLPALTSSTLSTLCSLRFSIAHSQRSRPATPSSANPAIRIPIPHLPIAGHVELEPQATKLGAQGSGQDYRVGVEEAGSEAGGRYAGVDQGGLQLSFSSEGDQTRADDDDQNQPYLLPSFFEQDSDAVDSLLFFQRLAYKTDLIAMIIEQRHNVTESLNSVVPEGLVGVCEVGFSAPSALSFSLFSLTLSSLFSPSYHTRRPAPSSRTSPPSTNASPLSSSAAHPTSS